MVQQDGISANVVNVADFEISLELFDQLVKVQLIKIKAQKENENK